ncbi:MAG: hypothetical protein ACP5QU_02595 [Anaerolineae bacterium]
MTAIEIGRLLRAGTGGFVAGCRVSQLTVPSFGALVMAQPEGDGQYKIYGLIYDIHIDDDGLVRQLVTSENISTAVMNDNRINRIVPVEMSVLAVGYEQDGQIRHLLPPRPPLSLDAIYLCSDQEIARFTVRLGYLRHILNAKELAIGEIIAAHLQQASQAHGKNSQVWKEKATQEVITLLRDDYPTLISVLSALSDVVD